MPKPKGLPKTGGRKKGTPNKKNAAMIEAVVKSGVTPLDYLLGVMRRPIPDGTDPLLAASIEAMRFEAAKAAAPYVHARLSTVETGKPGEFKELADKEALKQRIKARSVTLGLAKVLPIRGDKSAA